MPSPAETLRRMMDASCVPIPGAFSALCARAIIKAGFRACYVSGAATSVSAGVPDIGVLTLDHFTKVVREVADAARADDGTRLPVLADADTGFGEAEMVRRTVLEYARAGAAGLHLEDQVFPKRCGHLDGKDLIPLAAAADKVRWAAKAARDLSTGFLICARTDARGVSGLEAAIERARAYTEAGAEMIFPEGLATEDEFAKFAAAMGARARDKGTKGQRDKGASNATSTSPLHHSATPPLPPPYLLANMTEFGKTPLIPLARFQQMGYACVIYPVTLLRIAMGAVTRALETLHKDGSAAALIDQMQTRKDLYGLIGYEPGKEWEFPA